MASASLIILIDRLRMRFAFLLYRFNRNKASLASPACSYRQQQPFIDIIPIKKENAFIKYMAFPK